jgi:hypothetical protein
VIQYVYLVLSGNNLICPREGRVDCPHDGVVRDTQVISIYGYNDCMVTMLAPQTMQLYLPVG